MVTLHLTVRFSGIGNGISQNSGRESMMQPNAHPVWRLTGWFKSREFSGITKRSVLNESCLTLLYGAIPTRVIAQISQYSLLSLLKTLWFKHINTTENHSRQIRCGCTEDAWHIKHLRISPDRFLTPRLAVWKNSSSVWPVRMRVIQSLFPQRHHDNHNSLWRLISPFAALSACFLLPSIRKKLVCVCSGHKQTSN